MLQESIDYKSIPSNPLKDLIAFEERIQHNMASLHRLRFQALSTISLMTGFYNFLVRIFLTLTGSSLLFYFYFYQWPPTIKSQPWLSWICLIGSGLFAIMTILFIIHALYTRRLTLLNRYHTQCRKMLRIYNLDLRTGLDPKHINTVNAKLDKEYQNVMEQSSRCRYFLTVKRRFAGRAHDLLDAYRLEYWRRKLKKKQ